MVESGYVETAERPDTQGALQVLSTICNHNCTTSVPEGNGPDLQWIAMSTMLPG